MKYTVVWTPGAEQALTKLWIEAVNRNEISNADNTIDQLLQQGPVTVGESRENQTRILYVNPLAIYYDVAPIDALVRVWAVWRHPR